MLVTQVVLIRHLGKGCTRFFHKVLSANSLIDVECPSPPKTAKTFNKVHDLPNTPIIGGGTRVRPSPAIDPLGSESPIGMARSLRVRRIFLLSGLRDDLRDELGQKIQKLGGVYLETEIFKSNCTHVICGKLSRGEKFLGACATGKWILVPDYVHASAQANTWLPEAAYEWNVSRKEKGGYPPDIVAAPSRWRTSYEKTKLCAFSKWRVAVVVESLKRRTVYKRLLEDGGAEVFNLRTGGDSATMLVKTLTHVFVSHENTTALTDLMRQGFLCYKPIYIGDYLIKGGLPDPEKKTFTGKPANQGNITSNISSPVLIPGRPQKTPVIRASPSSTRSKRKKSNLIPNQASIENYCFVRLDQLSTGSSQNSEISSTQSVKSSSQRSSGTERKRQNIKSQADIFNSSGNLYHEVTSANIGGSSSSGSNDRVSPVAPSTSSQDCSSASTPSHSYSHGAPFTSSNKSRELSQVEKILVSSQESEMENSYTFSDQMTNKTLSVSTCSTGSLTVRRSGRNTLRSSITPLSGTGSERASAQVTTDSLRSNDRSCLSADSRSVSRGSSAASAPSGGTSRSCGGARNPRLTSVSLAKLPMCSQSVRLASKPEKSGSCSRPTSPCNSLIHDTENCLRIETPVSSTASSANTSISTGGSISTSSFSTTDSSAKDTSESDLIKGGPIYFPDSDDGRNSSHLIQAVSSFYKSPTLGKNGAEEMDVDISHVAGNSMTNLNVPSRCRTTRSSNKSRSESSESESMSSVGTESQNSNIDIKRGRSSVRLTRQNSRTLDVPSSMIARSLSRSRSDSRDSMLRDSSSGDSKLIAESINTGSSDANPVQRGRSSVRLSNQNSQMLLRMSMRNRSLSRSRPGSREPAASVYPGNIIGNNVKCDEKSDTKINHITNNDNADILSDDCMLPERFEILPRSGSPLSSANSNQSSIIISDGADQFINQNKKLCQKTQSTTQSIIQEATAKYTNHETPTDVSMFPTVKAIKRKILQELDIEDVVSSIKKQKISDAGKIWRPSVFGVSSDSRAKKRFRLNVPPMPISNSSTGIVETCLDDNYLLSALDVLFSVVSSKSYPRPQTLNAVMTQILQGAQSESLANRAYTFLRTVLSQHPPHPAHPAIRATYLQSLQPAGCHESNTGEEWQFVCSVISPVLFNPEDKEEDVHGQVYRDNNTLLLQYIVALLESDLLNLTTSRLASDLVSVTNVRSCLMGSVLWSNTGQINVTKRCRELLDFLLESLTLWKSDNTKVLIADLMLKMVSMLANLLCLADGPSQLTSQILKRDRVTALVYELSRRLCGEEECVLNLVLSRLSPPWLGLGVCFLLTGAMDDSLLPDRTLDDEGQLPCLRRIVTSDMYLLPPLLRAGSPAKVDNSRHYKLIMNQISKPMLTEDVPEGIRRSARLGRSRCSPVSSHSSSSGSPGKQSEARLRKLTSTVNKRNCKGETPLHIACIKNNVSKVRELLSLPGVQVNVRDNAGWTALHEASNRGHLDCVMELLRFRPARTLNSYFGKGEKTERVDLLAVNDDLITPLHDAVINNRLEVAHALVQYGGQRLLAAKTATGLTALDLVTSEEMIAVLNVLHVEVPATPRKLKRAALNSQCSQDSQNSFIFSQGSPSNSVNSHGPSPELYTTVLGEGTLRMHITRDECFKYVSIIQHLVRLYVLSEKLPYVAMSMNCGKQNVVNRPDFLIPNVPAIQLDTVDELNGSISSELPDYRCDLQGKATCGSSFVQSPQDSPVESEINSRLAEDVRIYLKLPEYLEGFRLHLKRICSAEVYRDIKPRLRAWKCFCL